MKLSRVQLRAFILAALTAIPLLSQERPSSAEPAKENAGLASQKICSFIAVRDAKRAISFYRDTLGLRLVREEPIALVFDANGVMLRVQIVGNAVSIAPYTVLGWNVSDIVATVTKLQKAGITLMRVPGIKQDELGIWEAGDGTRIAWFKDPDGHTLSVAQF